MESATTIANPPEETPRRRGRPRKTTVAKVTALSDDDGSANGTASVPTKRTAGTREIAPGERICIALDDFVSKNDRYRAQVRRGRPGRAFAQIKESPEARAWIAALAPQVKAAGIPKIDYGAWSLSVWTVWPTERHLDLDFPRGDSDATVSSVRDMLEKCGIVDNDVRIVTDETHVAYVKGERRLLLELKRLDEGYELFALDKRALDVQANAYRLRGVADTGGRKTTKKPRSPVKRKRTTRKARK